MLSFINLRNTYKLPPVPGTVQGPGRGSPETLAEKQDTEESLKPQQGPHGNVQVAWTAPCTH